MASWLKQVGHFEDADERICVAREKAFKRNTKKLKNLWNKIDFEIERMCDSASEAIHLAHSFHDKTRSAEAWAKKAQSLVLVGESEIDAST